MTRWDAVLFDLDGTLADTVELMMDCFRHTMRTHLGTVPEDALWIAGLGTPLERQLAGFARDENEVRAMRDTYRSYQLTIHDAMVRPYPGVPELMASLRNAGIPTAVVTSKTRYVADRTLAACALGDCFTAIITPEDVSSPKPDPEPVFAAMRAVGAPRAERTLFVGDAPADLLSGRAAGVRTGAALWGPFPETTLKSYEPDYLLASIEELAMLAVG